MTRSRIDKRTEIGKRIRAYRMGAGLSPEATAERLGISRAALYKYERTGVVKLSTIERFAELVGVSASSLLGASAEYFDNPISFFERKRQLELEAVQVFSYVEPISFLLVSKDYLANLRRMIVEGLPRTFADRKELLSQVDTIIGILAERHSNADQMRMNLTTVISAVQIERFLQTGMIGSYDLTPEVREQRRLMARAEIERLAAVAESEPIGVQIGIVDAVLPHQTFELLRGREETWVAVSPFRLGEFPNINLGVAYITSAPETVALYEKLSSKMWARTSRGVDAARLLRGLIRKTHRNEPDALPLVATTKGKSVKTA
jgi:transcriptional regulator with XRE-family HTH domain